jgi:hypothetical protein
VNHAGRQQVSGLHFIHVYVLRCGQTKIKYTKGVFRSAEGWPHPFQLLIDLIHDAKERDAANSIKSPGRTEFL